MQGGSINESMDEILFGTNFGLISDIEFGPDGALYVVSLLDGSIYKISLA
jgi:glucose/arabinose dehydrogenase